MNELAQPREPQGAEQGTERRVYGDDAERRPTARRATTRHATFAERRIRRMLAGSGVELNGANPWDPQVRNRGFYKRVLAGGSLGLGEAYMDNWWECAQLDEMYHRLMCVPAIRERTFASYIVPFLMSAFANLQSKARAFQVGEAHYDIGNDLYRAMLDERMIYTCGYWRDADNLDHAQRDKLELVCRKLGLQAGMRVLDIGCGWGGFAKYAAQNYGVEAVGVTVSKQQVELGGERCRGLPVELRLQDYRDLGGLNEKFDAIVSLGMFEHVGHKNYRAYMRIAQRCLKDKGKFLLQTIGKTHSRLGVDPWTAKYIFPNGEIPSLRQISTALESLMVIEDVHNFGADYDKTLMAWFANFHTAWPHLAKNYSDRFYRMWKYYLHVCAGAFRARDLQLWQIVISNGGVDGAYRRPEI